MKFLEGHPRPVFHTAVFNKEGNAVLLYEPGKDTLAGTEANATGGTTKSLKKGEKYPNSRGKEVTHGDSLRCGGDCRHHGPNDR